MLFLTAAMSKTSIFLYKLFVILRLISNFADAVISVDTLQERDETYMEFISAADIYKILAL